METLMLSPHLIWLYKGERTSAIKRDHHCAEPYPFQNAAAQALVKLDSATPQPRLCSPPQRRAQRL